MITVVVSVVTVVWVISFGVAILLALTRNDPLTNSIFLQVNTVFLTIVGGWLALRRRNGNGNGNGSPS